jgi:hypothetical protein
MKQNDFEIIDYDTEYLDAIEGHVTDVPAVIPTAYPQQTQRPNLVLPQHGQPNAVAGVLGQLMSAQPASHGHQDAVAIRHMEMMSERSSPGERTRAKMIQYVGWVGIASVITAGLALAGLDSVMAWIVFVGVFGYGVRKVNADENEHSPAGVERHKTQSYTAIRLAEIQAADRANARNHKTFTRVIESVYGADNAQDRNPSQR